MRLRDGRDLAYAQYGALDGAPIFHFHGLPGSRLQGAHFDAAARAARVRVIAVDRPGYGRSTRAPKRKILDWPQDIAELADALGIGAFAVSGHSGGAPYALACARALPGRVQRVLLLSGAGPAKEYERSLPWLRRLGYRIGERLFVLLARPSLWFIKVGARHMPASRFGHFPDRNVMRRLDEREAVKAETVEAFRQGIGGGVDDAHLLSQSWGFALAEVRQPAMLWHGEADRVVRPGIAHFVAARLPNCVARFLPHEEHLMFVDHIDEIVGAVRSPR